MKRQPPTNIKVHYYGMARTAAFNCRDDAIEFARLKSRVGGTVEVRDPSGLIGQFEGGKATPEFANLDVEFRAPREPSDYSDLRVAARDAFRTAVEAQGLTDTTADDLREALDEAIRGIMPNMNVCFAEILASDLGLGFPTDPVIREEDDIFKMIRGSIVESLRDDLDGDLNKAIEALADAVVDETTA